MERTWDDVVAVLTPDPIDRADDGLPLNILEDDIFVYTVEGKVAVEELFSSLLTSMAHKLVQQ